MNIIQDDKRIKTIADHMIDVLNECDAECVMVRDVTMLDYCAARCRHTTLMTKLPDKRHVQILNALFRSDKFAHLYTSYPERGMGGCRVAELKPQFRKKKQ